MPYIKKGLRKELDSGRMKPLCAGDLNYNITHLVNEFIGSNPCYDDYNAAIGVMECAKLELYRRRVAKYEDQKRKENGDVY